MIKKNHILFGLKIALSLALVGYVLQSVGVERAFSHILGASPLLLLVAGLLVVTQTFIGAFRWQEVLKVYGSPLSYWQAFRFFYIGAFFNQALPASVGGDAIRSYRAYKTGMKLGHAVGSVFLDRIATVLALLILVAAIVPFAIDGESENIKTLKIAVIVLLAVGLSGTIFLMFLDRVPQTLMRFRFVHSISAFASDVRKTFLSPSIFGGLMFWAIVGHVNLSFMVWVLSLSINVEISLIDCLALFPIVLLIQTMPISIAGWGVREGAMVAVFALVGVSASGALAVSLLFGIVAAIASLPGGWLWISSREHNMAEAETMAEVDIAAAEEIELFEQDRKK